jgi:Family of unknown function (DUF6288)
MKNIIPLLALTLSCLPVAAQVDYDGAYPWSQTTGFAPDNAVPGWFYNLGITGMRVQLDPAAPRTLVVKHVFPGTPAAAAGIQVNDVITGVEGQPFTADHQDGYGEEIFGARGPIGEFGIALDDAQGVDGLLGVTLTRGVGTLNLVLDVGQEYGSYSPTFPQNCPKSALILSELLTYLRQTQNAAGYWEGLGGHENHVFAGLALLSDGSAASMTAAGKLANYYKNETNGPIPADGLNNWKYIAAAIYLSEYYHKTNDATVLTKLNSIYGYLLASQYTNVSQIVPGAFGSDPTIFGFGGWGHNPGFEGYGPICMTTGQGALALALMKRVGVNVDRTRLDAAYDFIVKGTGANSYVWYSDGLGGGPDDWADPGRTGVAAIANWMSPYNEPAYATRAINHARFMGAHPQSFPDTHGSPTIGMAYAAMGAHFDPASFRQLLDNNRWWFSLAHTPEGNFYYQPNRDNAGYGTNPRFVASSVTALILSLPQRNLLISERVVESGFGANGTFQMYKPGTNYTVTATFADGSSYAAGVGDGITLLGGSVNYSDGTTGTTVDLPGWTTVQGANDLVANGVNGSTGMNLFASWGGDGRIQSAGSLGIVQDGGVYTISAMVGGPDDGPIQGPLAFHLLADGVQLTPTSSVNPTLPGGGVFQQISRTYQGAALAGHIGKSLTIVLGVENANDAGNRVIFDNVTIESPPTLFSITDNVGGGPIFGGSAVTYTVTFSEAMNAATVDVTDFDNAGSPAASVTSVTATGNPAVFNVAVTSASEVGTLRLRIKAGAVLTDLAGNQLDTTNALTDDTTIVVNAPPTLVCQLGILDLDANNGINPATGNPWAAGDKYRLIFVTSGTTACDSSDINTYNTFVQGLADAAGLGTSTLGPVSWKVVGSTATVAARDNTGTNPGVNGVGEPIYRMDGTFAVANNYADLWNGVIASHVTGQDFLAVHLDENNVSRTDERVRTGSNANGTSSATQMLGTGDVQTGRNYAPDHYGSYGANSWMQDWHASGPGRVYAISGILSIVATTPPDPYQVWLGEFTFAVGDDTTPTGDPDGDGMSNQDEFAFGLNPTLGSSVNPIVTQLDPGTGNFQYTRRATPAATRLTYTVLTSTDLAGWAEGGATETGFTTDGNIETVTVNVTAPAVGGKLFVRVEATPVP